MPPAFNLSQDQTLKFNPQNSRNLTISASTTISSCSLARQAAPEIEHPHLSVVHLFKEPLQFSASEEVRILQIKIPLSSPACKKIKPSTQSPLQHPKNTTPSASTPSPPAPSPETPQQERPHYRELSRRVKMLGEMNQSSTPGQPPKGKLRAVIHPINASAFMGLP